MKSLNWLLLLIGWTTTSLAEETLSAWPQFRGPNGSGVADDQHPPVELGPQKNVKWKVAAPSGVSSPVIAGDKVVLTAFEDGKLSTVAYRRADGQEAWRAEAPAKALEPFHKTESSPAASSAATDGQRIVTYFGSCGLFCYDLAGKSLWTYEMPPATTAGDFGSGVSPIIAEGLVILVRDQVKDAKIIAIDLATGSLAWETKRQSPASYSTPVIWNNPTGKQVVVAGHARLIAYDLKTGAEKWSLPGIPSGCCSSPVTADGLLLFAGGSPGTSEEEKANTPSFDTMLAQLDKDKDGAISRDEGEKAYQGFFDNQDQNKDGKITRDEWDGIMKFMAEGKSSAMAIKAAENGEVNEDRVLWKKTKGLPYVASAIAYRGQYVMIKDGVVTAYDEKTGDEIFQKRAAATGNYYASPVAAGGNIYFVSLNDGVVSVVKGGASKADEIARNEPLGERVAATPAIADHTLYIRTAGHLYAFASAK
jgi:outer membrane protein assembly factor BamB